MLSDLVTRNEMQAARLLMGATMVGFLVARLVWRRTPMIQFIVTGLYLASVLGFILYYAL
jgi:hypothetical protein